MKSRKEYEASIFAKRDALLEKRKKTITAVTSALCIVLCFAAAAIFMPKTLSKSGSYTTSTATTSTTQPTVEELVGMGGETGVFDAAAEGAENALYETTKEEVEYLTQSSDYAKPVTTSKETQKHSIGSVNFGYSGALPENTKETTAAAAATQTEIAFETEIYWENEDGCPEETTKRTNTSTTVAATRTNEHLASTAYGYLTDEQKSKVIDPETENITVTRTADGNEYYTVFFETENGGYRVSLDGRNLELIEVKTLANTTSNVSQGYNPDTTTAKPPMMPTTTAAPEYIPE